MRLFLLLNFLSLIIFANIIDNSFITKKEYGAMLYENPRGIGCIMCHGDKGQGSVIAKYRDKKGIEQTLRAPQIKEISYQKFRAKLKNQKGNSKVMPTYFLTDEEINSIYFYINKKAK